MRYTDIELNMFRFHLNLIFFSFLSFFLFLLFENPHVIILYGNHLSHYVTEVLAYFKLFLILIKKKYTWIFG